MTMDDKKPIGCGLGLTERYVDGIVSEAVAQVIDELGNPRFILSTS